MAKREEEVEEQSPEPQGDYSIQVEAFKASPELDKIAPALLAAQKILVNPEKNAKNPHFGNRYADLGVSLEAAQTALNKHDVFVFQVPAPAPLGIMALTTLLIHKSGQYIGGTATVPLDRDNAQGYGSAATYARRYSIQAVIGMAAEDDDDGQAASPSSKKGGKKASSLFP
jgi:hypothetical protein